MVKFRNIIKKFGRKPCFKGDPNPNPLGVARGKRAARSLGVPHKKTNNLKGIFHNGVAENHVAVIDPGHHPMIWMGGWEIVTCHDSWIYSQGFNMGGYPKGGRRFQLIDARGLVKTICTGDATW